jgi:hypothetical protein
MRMTPTGLTVSGPQQVGEGGHLEASAQALISERSASASWTDNYTQAGEKIAAELDQICPAIDEIALSGRSSSPARSPGRRPRASPSSSTSGCGLPVAAEYHLEHSWPVLRRDADTHVSVRAVNPAATVAYHDPVIGFEAAFLLEPAGSGIAVVTADLRDHDAVLEDTTRSWKTRRCWR